MLAILANVALTLVILGIEAIADVVLFLHSPHGDTLTTVKARVVGIVASVYPNVTQQPHKAIGALTVLFGLGYFVEKVKALDVLHAFIVVVVGVDLNSVRRRNTVLAHTIRGTGQRAVALTLHQTNDHKSHNRNNHSKTHGLFNLGL